MLDQQERQPALVAQPRDHLHQRLRLGRVESAGRLVEQQEPRLAGERPRELEPLLEAQRKTPRFSVRDLGEPEPGEQAPRQLARLGLLAPNRGETEGAAHDARAQMGVAADQDIVESRELAKHFGVLERAADAAAGDLVRR